MKTKVDTSFHIFCMLYIKRTLKTVNTSELWQTPIRIHWHQSKPFTKSFNSCKSLAPKLGKHFYFRGNAALTWVEPKPPPLLLWLFRNLNARSASSMRPSLTRASRAYPVASSVNKVFWLSGQWLGSELNQSKAALFIYLFNLLSAPTPSISFHIGH